MKDLSRTNTELKLAQNEAKRDMRMAINVQTSFLPAAPPQSDEWEIAYLFKPMVGVSGDFYDFYIMNDKLAGLGIFDVSGHGIASALVTMIAKSVIYSCFVDGYKDDLSDVINNANDRLQSEIGNVGNFITGIILRFNDNMVEYVNAGHNDIYLKKNDAVC